MESGAEPVSPLTDAQVSMFDPFGCLHCRHTFTEAEITHGVEAGRNMGVKNYLIEGISCTGKTSVCNGAATTPSMATGTFGLLGRSQDR